MNAKQLAEALSLCTPYTPKAVEMYRQHRGNQLVPPPVPVSTLAGQAIAELIDMGQHAQNLSNRLRELPPIAVVNDTDGDLYGC